MENRYKPHKWRYPGRQIVCQDLIFDLLYIRDHYEAFTSGDKLIATGDTEEEVLGIIEEMLERGETD